MKKIILVIIIFIIVVTKPVLALDRKNNSISFKNITISDGLSQNTVQYIFQDSDGYMWFGTGDGLNKYDGVEFEYYRYGSEADKAIASNWIIYINEDSEGDIWIGTTKGLNRINKATGLIDTYTMENSNLSGNGINGIFIDKNNEIIVFTENAIDIYDKEKDDFHSMFSQEQLDLLTDSYIYEIVQDYKGIYWLATEKGLNSYDRSTGEVKQYTSEDGTIIDENFIYDIYIDDKDILWICTLGGGLSKVNLRTNEVKKYRYDENNRYTIPSDNVTSVLRDMHGRVWVGTDRGLSRLLDDGSFITYDSKIYDTTSLVNNDILNMYEDKVGMIWIGTSSGLSYFNPNSIFQTYKNDPFNDNSLSGKMIFGVYEDKDKHIWVGTSENGVNVLDRKNEKIYRLSDIKEFKNINISNKIQDINGYGNEIWIATTEELVYINKDTKEVKKFLENNQGILRSIAVYKDEVWVSTSEGLYKIDKDHNIKDYESEFNNNNISEEHISVTFKDSKNNLWIGMAGNGGLIKYNEDTGLMKQYKNDPNDEKSLSYNSIRAITEDVYGNIWIGTNSGLNNYSYKSDVFSRYTEVEGLANNYVYDILIDEENNLWISTNGGISRFDQKLEKFINFNILDGLQDNEFNSNTGFKSSTGEMLFGGITGLNIFNPEEFVPSELDIDLIVDKVYIDGQYRDIKDTIELDYNEKNIKIEYFLPDYRNIKKVVYAYKLEGVDEQWIVKNNNRSIDYANIEPGEYTLRLKARNYLGEWLPEVKIKIYKEKEPWKTPLAYSIYLFTIIGIVYITWNKVKLLDSMVKSKTVELNNKIEENKDLYNKNIEKEVNKNNYFLNLSHELRTPLNIILSVEQLVTNLNDSNENIEKGKLKHYMEILRGNSKRLLKLIDDIINTSKIEVGAYKLNIAEHDIIYHVEEITFTMKDYIENKGIELIVDPYIEEKYVQCDIREIEKCLINLLSNAAKFTKAGGKIEVVVKEVDDKIKIVVKDTGKGISKEDIKGIFDRFGQAYTQKNEEYGGSGLGLALTKQLVELHGGQLLVESEIGVGSEFTIILPENNM